MGIEASRQANPASHPHCMCKVFLTSHSTQYSREPVKSTTPSLRRVRGRVRITPHARRRLPLPQVAPADVTAGVSVPSATRTARSTAGTAARWAPGCVARAIPGLCFSHSTPACRRVLPHGRLPGRPFPPVTGGVISGHADAGADGELLADRPRTGFLRGPARGQVPPRCPPARPLGHSVHPHVRRSSAYRAQLLYQRQCVRIGGV